MMCTVGGLLGGFPGSENLNTLINIHQTTFLLKNQRKRKQKNKNKKNSYLVNNSRLLYITACFYNVYLFIDIIKNVSLK